MFLRKLTKYVKHLTKLYSFEWDGILSIESADKQMEVFQNELFRMFHESFSEKTVTFLNDSQPFFSKKLLLLKEKKKHEYNKNRRSTKFLSLNKTYREAKRGFYKYRVRKLRKSNPKQWHKVLKRLISNDVPDEKIEVEDIKHLTNSEQVELIAEKFAEVANLYEPLDRSKITIPSYASEIIPKVECAEVQKILENMGTNKSCRKTDVPAKVLKTFARLLCGPLTVIINNCIQSGTWPTI